jgi:hypothetical protein
MMGMMIILLQPNQIVVSLAPIIPVPVIPVADSTSSSSLPLVPNPFQSPPSSRRRSATRLPGRSTAPAFSSFATISKYPSPLGCGFERCPSAGDISRGWSVARPPRTATSEYLCRARETKECIAVAFQFSARCDDTPLGTVNDWKCSPQLMRRAE